MKPFLFFLTGLCTAFLLTARAADTDDIVIRGLIRDRDSRRVLENVNVSAERGSVGTVSNADGVFVLKIPAGFASGGVRLSHVGYLDTLLSADELAGYADADGKGAKVIYMVPSGIELDAAILLGGDPRQIVGEALDRIPSNYAANETLYSAFYRETVRKGSRYVSVSEAVADVFKTDYSRRDITWDKVRILKGRRLISQMRRDTLAVKISGGPTLPLVLDVVKNGDALFEKADLDDYVFEMEVPVNTGGRLHYVISFRPATVRPYPLLEGVLYIDRENLALTRAEFSMDLSNRTKATDAVLRRRPAGLKFRPLEVSYIATYRQQNGRTYLNYVRNTIRFRCTWAKRLFASAYTSCTEMVMVDRREGGDLDFARREAFRDRQIFYDMVDDYWDADYWKDYNIIEPTESLEHAVNRLKKD